jgi:hypothetical protein
VSVWSLTIAALCVRRCRWDKTDDASLDANEFSECARCLGFAMVSDELLAMCDLNGDGRIELPELVRVLRLRASGSVQPDASSGQASFLKRSRTTCLHALRREGRNTGEIDAAAAPPPGRATDGAGMRRERPACVMEDGAVAAEAPAAAADAPASPSSSSPRSPCAPARARSATNAHELADHHQGYAEGTMPVMHGVRKRLHQPDTATVRAHCFHNARPLHCIRALLSQCGVCALCGTGACGDQRAQEGRHLTTPLAVLRCERRFRTPHTDDIELHIKSPCRAPHTVYSAHSCTLPSH